VRIILAGMTALLLSGCYLTLPSFYDDNESLLAVDVRMSVANLDCAGEVKPQVVSVDRSIQRLALYSESKGSTDVGEMIGLMRKTTEGMLQKDIISPAFCGIKKKVLEKQSDDVANAIMGRY